MNIIVGASSRNIRPGCGGFARGLTWRRESGTASEEDISEIAQEFRLKRKDILERLRIEAHLKRDGLVFVIFCVFVSVYFGWMMAYDPLQSISLVHQNLMSRFQIAKAQKIKTIDGINDYLDFFLKTSYGMASALVDASTLDVIDLDRCMSSDVEDVCQLKYWSLPIDRPGDPEYVNTSALERDTLAPSNAASAMDCGRPGAPENCIPRGPGSPNVDPRLTHRTFGLTPEDPVILRSRLDYPLASVVALSPLALTQRAPRVDCDGFGLVYNDHVLGAGSCSADTACDPQKVTSFKTTRPNPRTNRTQSIFFTYEEFAFHCVDRSIDSEEWRDKSWSPWATYEELTAGKFLSATELDGKEVFWKFISNLAYLQAPIAIPLSDQHCQLKQQHPDLSLQELCELEDARCIDPMRRSDHAMWSESLGYEAECSLRKAWSDAYLATPIEERKNVWFTIETTELAVAILVITPQMANVPDLVTLVKVAFKVGQFGDITSEVHMETSSVTTEWWTVLSIITASCAVLHAVASWLLLILPHQRSRKMADALVSAMCLAHIAWQYYVEVSPPHIMEELRHAFETNEQEHYFTTFKDIMGYTTVLRQIKVFGFVTATIFFCRFITHLTIHPRLAVLPMTLYVCLPDIVQFFVSLAMIELFLACFAYIAFATQHPEYSTVQRALWTQMMMFVGEKIADPNRPPGMLYLLYLFIAVLVVIMALLNFLLAIIVDGYGKVTSALAESEAEGSLFEDVYDALLSVVVYHFKRWPHQRVVAKALECSCACGPVTAEELLQLRLQRDLRGQDEEEEPPKLFKSISSVISFMEFYGSKRQGALKNKEDEGPVQATQSGGAVPVSTCSESLQSAGLGDKKLAERQIELEGQIHELKLLAQRQVQLQEELSRSVAALAGGGDVQLTL